LHTTQTTFAIKQVDKIKIKFPRRQPKKKLFPWILKKILSRAAVKLMVREVEKALKRQQI
jgi:hypothetical protein